VMTWPRSVPDRLAGDFWVKPSKKMVRLWSRAFADEVDFSADYQPWVVANFWASCAWRRCTRAILRCCRLWIRPRRTEIDWSPTRCCQSPEKSIKVWSGSLLSACERLASCPTRSSR
jgi:hypothetical protein